MNNKGIRIVKIVTALIILSIAGYFAYLPLKQKPIPQQSMPTKVTSENESNVKQQTPLQAANSIPQVKEIRNVSPVFGLDSLIENITNDVVEDADRAINLMESRDRFLSLKRQGHTFWGTEEWMKEPDYYRNLDTITLAAECFQYSIFRMETIAYDDPAYVFQKLEIFHNGFAELFQRDDMWKGILHVYYQAIEKISPDHELKTVLRQSLRLCQLRCFYSYSPFEKQLKGHEREFLNATIAAINKHIAYLDTYDPDSDEPPFVHTPCSIVEVALMLTKLVEPQQYAEIESVVNSIRWNQRPTVGEIKQYLELVAGYLDENNLSDN